MAVLLVFIINLSITLSEWLLSTTRMPVQNRRMGIGADNGIIFLIGGDGYVPNFQQHVNYMQQSLVEYDINKNEFSSNLSFFDQCWDVCQGYYGQYSLQLHSKVYIAEPEHSSINVFDLSNKQFTKHRYEYTHATTSYFACMTGRNDIIYSLGGFYAVMLNTSNEDPQWETAPAWRMNTPRQALSCVITSNNTLYAIGGIWDPEDNPKYFHDTIEYTYNNTWLVMTQTLTEPLADTRAVIHEDNIFVIGGRNNCVNIDICHYIKKVHIINVLSHDIILSDDELIYGSAYGATIFVNGIIYLFGGYQWNDTVYPREITLDTIQYYVLETQQPTLQSNAPSMSPSVLPSNVPSAVPTDSPLASITSSALSTQLPIISFNRSESSQDQSDNIKQTHRYGWTALSIILGILLSTVLVVLAIYYWRKVRTKQVENLIANTLNCELETIDD